MFDKNDLKALIALAEAAEAQDQDMLVADVLADVNQAYMRTRDASLHALHNVLTAKHRSDMLISKSELSAAYAKVAGLGKPDTVREALGHLIEFADGRAVPVRTSMLGNGTDLDISVSQQNLDGIWNTRSTVDTIKAELADFGVEADIVLASQGPGLVVYSVDAKLGNKSANFLVPAEVRNASVLLPSAFYGAELAEFNKEQICRWVEAGGRSNISAAGLLDHLTSALGNKVAASNGGEWQVGVSGGPSVDLGSAGSPVLPNAEVSDQMPAVGREFGGAAFEQIFAEATAKCGLPAVQAAKRVVTDGLRFAGVSFDPVSIEREGDSLLVIGTHIRTAAGKQYISVPVELRGSVALEPSIFTASNAVRTWGDSELRRIASSGEVDFRAEASDLRGAKFGALYKMAMTAAAAGNLQQAEEAMSAIMSAHGPEHYEQTLRDVMGLVSSNAADARVAGDRYYEQLAKDGDEIAGYISSRANLRDFGLID